ncbi:MAG: hypothetical protein WHS89_03070 [Acidimicrobiales bacterium]
MGRASSSKKVARAARAGASVRPRQHKLAFPLAIFAIVVLGLGLIMFARGESGLDQASAEAPTSKDHWHNAYGFYVCNAFGAPLVDIKADTTGIHTHGDGLIHIHPFSDSHGGKNATLAKWGEMVGVKFGSTSITMPDGTKYENGMDCNGQPANVRVYVWPADDPNAEPVIYDRDFGKVRLDADRKAITIAIAPDGTEVPRPPSVPNLENPVDAPGGGSPSTTVAPAGSTQPTSVIEAETDSGGAVTIPGASPSDAPPPTTTAASTP